MATVDHPPIPVPRRSSQRSPATAKSRSILQPSPSSRSPLPYVPNRRASKRATIQSASPEVISSLISSLSAISAGADDLFDNLPIVRAPESAPPTPGTNGRNTFQNTKGNRSGFGMDYGAFKAQDNPVPVPSDAAISPVIRTSKPPSGLSPITAPRKGSPHRVPDAPTWPLSIPEPVQSIGNLSIDSGPRHTASVKSFGSGSKPGSQGQKSLNLKASKEKMKDLDRERKRKAVRGSVESGRISPTIRPQTDVSRAPDSPMSGRFVTGEDRRLPTSKSAHRARSMNELVNAPPPSDTREEIPGGIGCGKAIPTRESSLRHSIGSPPSRRKRKSTRHPFPASENKENNRPTKSVAVSKVPDDATEDVVSKRIRELKAQKELRERSRSNASQKAAECDKAKSPGHLSLPAPALPKDSSPRSASASRAVSKQPGSTNGRHGPVDRSTTTTNQSSDLSQEVKPANHAGSSTQAKGRARPVSPVRSQKPRPTSSEDDRPSTADSIDDAVDNYLSAPRLSQKIRSLSTGRIISYSDVGDPEGCVIFCCVGMGLTRYLTAFYDELALTLNLRLITPDRPGVGESEPQADGSGTPLSWPDDIRAICQHLHISRFSILAHSAGAIYALATALRMPQHIRGRIHLLAPWIPPSQMVSIGIHNVPLPTTTIPYSQRILRSLPTPFLKAANSSFFSVTSTSITTSLPNSPRRVKRKSLNRDTPGPSGANNTGPSRGRRGSLSDRPQATIDSASPRDTQASLDSVRQGMISPAGQGLSGKERQSEYDNRLTTRIWELATTNANPAVDLLVCLERRQEIGFRYVDITKSVVIHHGTKDTRVPLDNVKWLEKTMRRCELRVLEGEAHGLMAVAGVMGNVLTEMAQEWEDWNVLIRSKKGKEHRTVRGKEPLCYVSESVVMMGVGDWTTGKAEKCQIDLT